MRRERSHFFSRYRGPRNEEKRSPLLDLEDVSSQDLLVLFLLTSSAAGLFLSLSL